ncbi:Sulfur globule protein [Mycobacterium sp. smrl_JER01]
MKRFGSVGIVAGIVSAFLIGLAGAAQAADNGSGNNGRDGGVYSRDSNYPWRDQLQPKVKVPRVDTSVRNSR